jgi:hypothetical protein
MSNGGFSVDPSSLKAQAHDWEQYASSMQGVFGEMQAAEIVIFPALLFSNIASPFKEACAQAETWCVQGLMQMSNIAAALLTAAGNYQAAEAVNAWAIEEQTSDRIAQALNVSLGGLGADQFGESAGNDPIAGRPT